MAETVFSMIILRPVNFGFLERFTSQCLLTMNTDRCQFDRNIWLAQLSCTTYWRDPNLKKTNKHLILLNENTKMGNTNFHCILTTTQRAQEDPLGLEDDRRRWS